MNDMRLPGIGPFSADAPANPGTDAARDPAQAFDAVMSRFAGDRPHPNTTTAQDKARDPRENRGPKAAPAEQARPADKPAKGSATDGTSANGKPAARTRPDASDEDGEAPATSAATNADPAVLAAMAAAAAAAAQAGAPAQATAATQENAAKAAAGRDAGAEATDGTRAPLDVLAAQVNAGAGRRADMAASDPRAEVRADTENAASVPGAAPRRAPAAEKDTLRIDAPLKRAMDVVQGEAAARTTAAANPLARSASTLATPSPDATPQTLTTAIAAATHTPAAPATYSVAHAAVGAPVGSTAFAEELSQRVVMFAGHKVQRADIAVTPADLGPIAVSIEVRGQEATLAFTAASHATRAAIEDALPRLRDMLSSQGLFLAGAHVGSEPRRDAYRPAQGGTGGRGSRPSNGGVNAAAAADAPAVRRRVNLIDIEV